MAISETLNLNFSQSETNVNHIRKVWKIIPLPRTVKELLKNIFFGILPFLFKRLKAYKHWKSAQVFKGKMDKTLPAKYWQNILRGFYDIDPELHQTNKMSSKPDIRLAVVIHVFYLDVFKDILNYLLKSDYQEFKLYITHPAHLEKQVSNLLKGTHLEYSTLTVENKGRDILPFLRIIPDVLKDGYNLVLKLHTKKSNYLNKRNLWSHQLFHELIGNDQIQNCINLFQAFGMIGMIAPFGHIVPLSMYYGANAERLTVFAERLGFAKNELNDMVFAAGTMFYARKEVLEIMIKLYNNFEVDFEPEEFQIDGTLAHVMERAFSLCLKATGLKLADSHSVIEKVSCRVVLNHPFVL